MPKELNIFERNAKKIVFFTIITGSTSSIFTKFIEAPSMVIGFYRLAFAMPFFLLITLLWHREALFKITKKQLFFCFLAGAFLACHFFSWFSSLKLTSVASAAVLALTHPMVILLVNTLIFKEKTNKKAVAGVLIAFAGAAVISGGDYSFSREAIIGDLFAVCAAIFMALYFLVGQKARKDINASVYVLIVFSVAWIIFGLGMIMTKTPFTGYTHSDYGWIFAMSMVCQIGTHAIFNWLLAHVEALYIATWENGEAVIATILAIFIFKEIPTIWQLVGGAIVICGLVYYTKHESDSESSLDATCENNRESHQNISHENSGKSGDEE